MPCFPKISSERFAPIAESERDLLTAIIELTPEVLAPIRTQLDEARTCDDAMGWLLVRNARGEPCDWRAGYPFEVVANWPGPQGCYDILLWFCDAGRLEAVEFLLLENEPLDLKALTAWLKAEPLSATPPSS